MWFARQLEGHLPRVANPLTNRLPTVFLGFTGLLLLMGVLVIDSRHQLREVRVDSSRIQKEYRDRDALLDEFRTNISHAAAAAKDYLLLPENARVKDLRTELSEIRHRNRAVLARYSALVLPAERGGVAELQQASDSYLNGLSGAFMNGASPPAAREAYFRDHVLRHRSELNQLEERVDAMDRRDMNAGEERIEALQAGFERRVASISTIALLVSAVLAVLVILRQQYLVREAQEHFDEVVQARRDLRQLSNQVLAAHEEERRRISRELHDEVGQSMSAMLMELGRLETRLSGSDGSREILASMRKAAEENVARVRDLSLLLRPSMLDELGLVPALEWQAREVTRRHGVRVRMIADDFDLELPDEHRTCMYRIVQEALHNCVKHSRATEVRLMIGREEDAVLVSVQDDGAGFDTRTQRGLGLLGIEERALKLGGQFLVESEPGCGTVLSVRLPLPAHDTSPVPQEVA